MTHKRRHVEREEGLHHPRESPHVGKNSKKESITTNIIKSLKRWGALWGRSQYIVEQVEISRWDPWQMLLSSRNWNDQTCALLWLCRTRALSVGLMFGKVLLEEHLQSFLNIGVVGHHRICRHYGLTFERVEISGWKVRFMSGCLATGDGRR